VQFGSDAARFILGIAAVFVWPPPGSARRKSRFARALSQPPRVLVIPTPASVACTACADSPDWDHADRTRGVESLRSISGDACRRAAQVGAPSNTAAMLIRVKDECADDRTTRTMRTSRTVVCRAMRAAKASKTCVITSRALAPCSRLSNEDGGSVREGRLIARWVSELLVAFDSNVLTAFLNANSRQVPSVGDDLKAFQLFMYSPKVTILPTVTAEAERISADDKREEHLKWVWYHFPEAQLSHEEQRIGDRTQELLEHHPERDADDCRIVAEAEAAGVTVLATIDRRIKRLQAHTCVRLLSPAGTLEYLAITTGAQPEREPGAGHPLAGASWWHI